VCGAEDRLIARRGAFEVPPPPHNRRTKGIALRAATQHVCATASRRFPSGGMWVFDRSDVVASDMMDYDSHTIRI
jgi:hypothetical protein